MASHNYFELRRKYVTCNEMQFSHMYRRIWNALVSEPWFDRINTVYKHFWIECSGFLGRSGWKPFTRFKEFWCRLIASEAPHLLKRKKNFGPVRFDWIETAHFPSKRFNQKCLGSICHSEKPKLFMIVRCQSFYNLLLWVYIFSKYRSHLIPSRLVEHALHVCF